MTDNLSPQLGGQAQPSNISTSGNEPELPDQRPDCKRCGKTMTPAPIVLMVSGVRLPAGAAWHCECDPRNIDFRHAVELAESMGIPPNAIGETGEPTYRFVMSYEFDPQE
jgi:hypothetical protein